MRYIFGLPTSLWLSMLIVLQRDLFHCTCEEMEIQGQTFQKRSWNVSNSVTHSLVREKEDLSFRGALLEQGTSRIKLSKTRARFWKSCSMRVVRCQKVKFSYSLFKQHIIFLLGPQDYLLIKWVKLSESGPLWSPSWHKHPVLWNYRFLFLIRLLKANCCSFAPK